MTKEELFPKEKYPLRARAEMDFPEKHFKMVMEAYYQKPPMEGAEQLVGIYTYFIDADGAKYLGVAEILPHDDDIISYLEKNGGFTEMSLAEIDDCLDEDQTKFEQKYGVNLDDEDTQELLMEKFESLRWESF